MRTPAPILSLIAVIAMVVLTAMVSIDVLWKGDDGEGWKRTIRSDARGYYGYLTSIFIRNDLGNEPFAWEYVHRTPSGTLNKYFSGTAVMMAPWFAIGHQLALLDPAAPRDGHSEYEMKAISIGGWIYLLIGLLALRWILLRLHIRDEIVAWLMVVLGAGSTLLQYAAVQPGWSHIYSFCAVAVFLLLILKIHQGRSLRWLIPASIVLGLIILIRPVNALVVLGIPVLLGKGTWHTLGRIFAGWEVLAIAIILGAAIVAIQPLLWHAQTGNWFEWGYRGEGFYWGRPEILNILFSVRRGLFVWTPVFLLAAIGALLLWRRDRSRSSWALIYWGVNCYVIGCWWIWYYGSGFGSRVFVEHYPVLILPLAFVLDRASVKQWLATRIFFTLCIALHLAQFAQYHGMILHHERMDARKYAFTFLRFDRDLAGALGGKIEVPPYHPNGIDPVLIAATDLERAEPRWRGGRIIEHPKAFSGSHVCAYDRKIEFGTTFIAEAGQLPIERDLWLELRFMRYESKAGASSTAIGVIEITRADGSRAYYDPFKINHVPGQWNDHWETLEHRVPVPPLRKGEKLTFYIWNQHRKAAFLIDDLFVRVWAVRPY